MKDFYDLWKYFIGGAEIDGIIGGFKVYLIQSWIKHKTPGTNSRTDSQKSIE